MAKEFKDFCNQQGMLHSLTPPYHPKSNGQAERFIQSFKRAVRKGLETPGANLQDVVTDFLMVYRSTEHDTTGESPSKLLLGRELRCSLNMLVPELPAHQDQTKQLLKRKVQECQERQKKRHDHTSHERKPFQLGAVFVRQPESKQKGFWKPATILKVLGQRYYMVRFLTGTTRKVHMNHLSSRILSLKTCHSLPADIAITTDSDSDDSIETEKLPRRSQRRTKGQPPERLGEWV